MDLNFALKLLRLETSAGEIAKLQKVDGFSKKQVVDTINEAIEMVCDCAELYKKMYLEK